MYVSLSIYIYIHIHNSRLFAQDIGRPHLGDCPPPAIGPALRGGPPGRQYKGFGQKGSSLAKRTGSGLAKRPAPATSSGSKK